MTQMLLHPFKRRFTSWIHL